MKHQSAVGELFVENSQACVSDARNLLSKLLCSLEGAFFLASWIQTARKFV